MYQFYNIRKMHGVMNARTLAIAVFCLLFLTAFSGAAFAASDGYIDVKIKNSNSQSKSVDVYIDGSKAGYVWIRSGRTETLSGFEVDGDKKHTVKIKWPTEDTTTSSSLSKNVPAGGTTVFSFTISCSPTCSQDSDCDDGDSRTRDICKYAGTCDSYCYNDREPYQPSQICTPGAKRCNGNALEQCNAQGSAWQSIQTCQYGCDSSALACLQPSSPPAQSESVDCNIQCSVLQNGEYECNTDCEDIMPADVSFFAISAGAVGWKLAGIEGAEDIGLVITRNIHDVAIPKNTLGIASGLRNVEHYSIKLFSKVGEKLFEMRVVKDAGKYFGILGEKIKVVEPVLSKILKAFVDDLPVSKSWLNGALKSLEKAAASTLRIIGKQGSAKIGGLLLAPLRILSSAPVAAVSLFLLLDEIPAGDNASVFDKIIEWLDHLVNWKSYDSNFCLPSELKGSPYFSNRADSEFCPEPTTGKTIAAVAAPVCTTKNVCTTQKQCHTKRYGFLKLFKKKVCDNVKVCTPKKVCK